MFETMKSTGFGDDELLVSMAKWGTYGNPNKRVCVWSKEGDQNGKKQRYKIMG